MSQSNIWELLLNAQAASAQEPMMSLPPEDDEEELVPGGMSVGNPASTVVVNKPMPTQRRSMEVVREIGNAHQPSYSQQFDDAYKGSMDMRREQLEALKQKLAQVEGNKPTGLAALNLKPFAAFTDSLTGNKTVQNYDEPVEVKRHMDEMQRLEKAMRDDGNSLSDDQLNYLKLKASEERDALTMKRLEMMAGRGVDNNEDKLRKEYMNHPLYKNMAEINKAYTAIASNQALDGPSQQALVYQYSKLLDPGSVVRETEYAMSAANAGKLAEATNYFNKLKTGQMLTPEQVKLMKQVAMELADAARSQVNVHNDTFTELAKRKGVDPSNVVIDPFYKGRAKTSKVKVSNGTEILEIDASDLPNAIQEGYKQVN